MPNILRPRFPNEGEGPTPAEPKCTHVVRTKEAVWTNCCSDDPEKSFEENCPYSSPKKTKPILGMVCPGSYNNCGNLTAQPDFCSADHSGYSQRYPAAKKCCPQNYLCGSSFTQACFLNPESAEAKSTNETLPIRAHPLVLKRPGIFPGCDDAHEIKPAAVGGVVALVLILFVGGCALGLWIVRIRLYRDPIRARQRSIRKAKLAEMLEMEGMKDEKEMVSTKSTSPAPSTPPDTTKQQSAFDGITVTREIKVEGDVDEKKPLKEDLAEIARPEPAVESPLPSARRWDEARRQRASEDDPDAIMSYDDDLGYGDNNSSEELSPGRVRIPKLTYRR